MSEIKYINANKLKSDLKECQEILSTTFDDNEEEQFAKFLTGVFGVIDYEPAANIQEVPYTNCDDCEKITFAEWIPCKNKSGFKCSNCKARVKTKDVVNGTHKYCYRCGAEMSSHITICGAYECDGCLYQHRGDIELCKKQKGEYSPWMKTKK